MKKPIIFLGPSLSHEKARKIFQADFRGPAKKGDLLRASGDIDDSTIVCLVDALFLQDYPPSPIEVYQLMLNKNIKLYGAASLGALRAVELEKFGMIGMGKIFELYKKGKLTADDEIAVTFVEGEHQLQSEAMIDIRFNLFLAHRMGIINEITKKTIAKVAKDIYFPYRNYTDILDQTQKQYPAISKDLKSFRTYIIKNRQSLKERDTIKLINYVKQLLTESDRNEFR
ncbi:MAG TPA: TfuA-like protein [Nitrososphaeraceae archaeon]|nr:TfuA-like protein [Nitrososphaeraceae archaeon]